MDATALAKQTQNPVADLVSIPFQFNFNSGGGLGDGTLYNLNIQPVIPITLNEDWKLIARAIVPYISSPAPDGGQEGGFGDIQLQSYFTPGPQRQGDLGHRSAVLVSGRDESAGAHRLLGGRAGRRGPDHAGALGHRRPGQPALDLRRQRR